MQLPGRKPQERRVTYVTVRVETREDAGPGAAASHAQFVSAWEEMVMRRNPGNETLSGCHWEIASRTECEPDPEIRVIVRDDAGYEQSGIATDPEGGMLMWRSRADSLERQLPEGWSLEREEPPAPASPAPRSRLREQVAIQPEPLSSSMTWQPPAEPAREPGRVNMTGQWFGWDPFSR